jgi:prevent-host-death family protein
MPMTTLSSREFNQDTSKAKKAAKSGPVFITDRGRPAHVLLSIEHSSRWWRQPPASSICWRRQAQRRSDSSRRALASSRSRRI